MITVEVLISLIILFTVIVTSVTSVKHLFMIEGQKELYEHLYMSVLNIKDKIDGKICTKTLHLEGTLGESSYEAHCTKIKEMRNYTTGFDDDEIAGNNGKLNVQLYKIDLDIISQGIQKHYTYYKTNTIRLKK